MFGQDCMWDCTWKNKFPSTFDVFYGFSDVFCRKYISDALHSTVMLKSSIETVDIFCPQPILSFCQKPFLLELEGQGTRDPLGRLLPLLDLCARSCSLLVANTHINDAPTWQWQSTSSKQSKKVRWM